VPTLERCRCCGKPVSSEAASCPHCGQPTPFIPLKPADMYECRVLRFEPYGAYVAILPDGQHGLIHISELSVIRVREVSEVLSVGDVVNARVLSFDDSGMARMTMLTDEQRSERTRTSQSPRGGRGGERGGRG